MVRHFAAVGVVVVLTLVGIERVAAGSYPVTDVTPGWDCYSLNPDGAMAVNASGQVAGVGFPPGEGIARPFFWDGTTCFNLGKAAFSSQARGFGINNAGTVVGWGIAPMQAWYNPAGGTMTTLPYLSGGTGSAALAINTAGEIGGYSNGPGTRHAVIWSNGTLYDLITSGSTWITKGNSKVAALSNNGIAVGSSEYGDSPLAPPTPHALISTYTNTSGVITPTSIADIDVALGGGGNSSATGVNERNQVVGFAGTWQSGGRSFLYSIPTGTVTFLGCLADGTQSSAQGISNSGLVVGWSFIDSGGTTLHAFIYNGGQLIDMNNLIDPTSGWTLRAAYAINGNYIVGQGFLNGVGRGFRLELLPGDANLDSKVDVSDLNKVLTNYDQTGMNWSQGDFDGNGIVDISDLNKVLTNYDKSAGVSVGGISAVPEPSAVVLFGVGAMSLVAYAWRKRRWPRAGTVG